MRRLSRQFTGQRRPDGDRSITLRATVRSVDYDTRRLEVAINDPDSTLQDEEETLDVPYLGPLDYYAEGDTVLLLREVTGPIALGAIGTALEQDADAAVGSTSTPTGLSLDRSGATVDASCSAVSGATQYRWRATYNGGSSWQPTKFSTDASKSFSVAQGKTIGIQVAAYKSTTGWSAWSSTVSVTRPEPTEKYETVTTTVSPVDSGTYRVGSGWDRWNTTRFGGKTDVYQEDVSAYGSGQLVGWAGYGNRISGLGAVEITKMVLTVKRNGWGNYGAKYHITVRGTATGTNARSGGAPSGTGDSQSGPDVAMNNSVSFALPASVREAFRTGSIKGLITTGSDPSGWYASGSSFTLRITYRKKV